MDWIFKTREFRDITAHLRTQQDFTTVEFDEENTSDQEKDIFNKLKTYVNSPSDENNHSFTTKYNEYITSLDLELSITDEDNKLITSLIGTCNAYIVNPRPSAWADKEGVDDKKVNAIKHIRDTLVKLKTLNASNAVEIDRELKETLNYISQNQGDIFKKRNFIDFVKSADAKSTAKNIVEQFMVLKDSLGAKITNNISIQKNKTKIESLKGQFDSKKAKVTDFNNYFNKTKSRLLETINNYNKTSWFPKKHEKKTAMEIMKDYLEGKQEFSAVEGYINNFKQATSGIFSHRVADMFKEIQKLEAQKPFKGPILIPNPQTDETNTIRASFSQQNH